MMKVLNDYFSEDGPLFFGCFRSPVWAYDFPDTDELDTYFGNQGGLYSVHLYLTSEQNSV